MGPAIVAFAVLASMQKPQSDNTIFLDVPDNHFAYAMLLELKSDGLLPELQLPLTRGDRPLTRGQIGAYVTEATINLQRHVDNHRPINPSAGMVSYSAQISDFSADQLKYLVDLVPRLRKVAKAFSANLPSYVKWQEIDRSLQEEGTLLDGLVAGS